MLVRRSGSLLLLIGLLASIIPALPLMPVVIAAPQAAAQSASESHLDFNGDGYEDLAIGVPEENIGSIRNAGAVNVLYGSGLQTASPADQFWHQDSQGVEDGAENSGEYFGFALA